MKRLLSCLLLILALFLVVSCTNKPSNNKVKPLATFELANNITTVKRLSKASEHSLTKTSSNLDYRDVQKINEFAFAFTKLLFDGKSNQIFSPVSLYFCLAMLYVGTSDEEIRASIENLMRIDDEESLLLLLKQIEKDNYYFNELGRTYLANSIWISKSFQVLDSYVAKLQNEFNAQSFEIDFYDYDAREQIINWLNHYTENLLDLDQEKLPIAADTAILLANTLYFNNKWQNSALNEVDKPFYLSDGRQVTVKYFEHEFKTLMKETKEYLVIQDYFENDNKITFIMAKNDLLDLTQIDYQNFLSDLTSRSVNLYLPPFEAFSEYDLEDAFYQNGCGRIYQHVNGYRLIGEELYVSLIKQDAGIKLDAEGVEAAAVTIIGMKAESAMVENEIYYLDHPFMYIISDANDVPLFVGTVTNPTK